MAFHKDFAFVVEGDVIAYTKAHGIDAAALPPNQGLRLRFPALDGMISIRGSALDLNNPHRIRVAGGHLDPHNPEAEIEPGGTIEEFNHVAVVIELIPPGQNTPVKRLTTESGFSENEEFMFDHVITAPAPQGQWEVRVTNRDHKSARVSLSANSLIDREPLHTASLGYRVLDHAYLVILEALHPLVRISGNTITIAFSEELRGFFGAGANDTNNPLATQKIELPSGIEGEGRLTSFEVRARSGRTLLDAVLARFQAVKDATERQIAQLPETVDTGPVRLALKKRLESNDKFRQEWEGRVRPDDAVVYVSAAFSDITIVAAADLVLFDVDAQGVIHKATVDIFIAFDRNLGSCDVLALAPPIDIELTDSEAVLADALGLIPALNQVIEEELPRPIEDAGRQIGRFLGEALARLANRESVIHSLTANDSNWLVHYTAVPQEPTAIGSVQSGISRLIGGGSTHGPIGGGGTVNPNPGIGVLPPADQFVVVKPETLARLDKIETLVFVMMENRSFDHMLGYLRQTRGPQYEGLSGGESNKVAGRTQPVFMRHARDIVPGRVTQIPISPSHDFKPVEGQIADGAMSGFAQDFENRHPGFAELVMTFYTGEELKVYDELAANYNVCDHWYCAHPGPTFPNRFVTLTGFTTKLDNHDIDDPILGFLPERTIFDVLNECGVDWAVFESDLSIIRMFDRFRLNGQQVRPYIDRDDPSRSFAEVAKRGELPPVVFVEPNFVDIPPISTATDDHPPADLRRGQNFIAEVVKALRASPDWERTMLAITYDEHGGFFDHIAPPGTALGRPEFIGTIPRIHPDGQDFMGPRVPAFVVSPLVSAGSVCKDILDHTSIIKTILLHQRRKIPTRLFTGFGQRVNMIAHLGVALDLDRPRTDMPGSLERMRIDPEASAVAAVTLFPALPGPGAPDDFHESLRRAPLPKRK